MGANCGRALGQDIDRAFTTHLFGHVLSFVLLKKGLEPLHSTVLAAPGGAIGILGDSGYGKSTLAAALIGLASAPDRRPVGATP